MSAPESQLLTICRRSSKPIITAPAGAANPLACAPPEAKVLANLRQLWRRHDDGAWIGQG
jgi:hypothetical protein